jgi:pimeloyl-ACP methyl ester carboxylesterase
MNDTATDSPGLQFTRANGIEFACHERGSGPLVLCLHGFADSADSFRPLLAQLAHAGFRGIAPFMRGYAPSALAPDGDYGLRALALDVVALIDHFGAERAAVVGHDFGALAAYGAANLRPDRVSLLVTAGLPHPRRLLLRPSLSQIARMRHLFAFQWQGWAERRLARNDFAALRALAARASPGGPLGDDDWLRIRSAFEDRARLSAALGYARGQRRLFGDAETWRLATAAIAPPTRMIYGARDGLVGAEMFTQQEHLFPGGLEIVRMETGHLMHREQPPVFAQVVTGLLVAARAGGLLPTSP